ncbi:MAG: hypothetical protein IJJ33_13085 [Victivallales bacterium]|nr:hypothetical protein [Victivallales bacterium]
MWPPAVAGLPRPLAEPDLLMVITGGEIGYTREDGVHVVPISALKP